MASLPESPAPEGIRSLEVRWIFPGRLEAEVAGWFSRFPAAAESQQDSYLLDPHLRGLSVKIRGDRAFEVKMYRGSPGTLDVAGRGHGHIQSWQKWSFPFAPLSEIRADPAGWILVSKKRRVSGLLLAGGRVRAVLPGLGEEPGCAVELTEVRLRGEAWWTLAFEATGPAGLLHRQLEATAALVFDDALPGGWSSARRTPCPMRSGSVAHR